MEWRRLRERVAWVEGGGGSRRAEKEGADDCVDESVDEGLGMGMGKGPEGTQVLGIRFGVNPNPPQGPGTRRRCSGVGPEGAQVLWEGFLAPASGTRPCPH
eukprot:365790-Chlamydomonas_euryale.AAC.4